MIGGKSKKNKHRLNRTRKKTYSALIIYNKLNSVKLAIEQTLNYGLQYTIKRNTIGGAIIDDTNFISAEQAFNYFLQNSSITTYTTNSICGRVAELTLNSGIQSPYTSYDRNTFIDLNIGNIRSLIIKFVLVDKTRHVVQFENGEYLQSVKYDEFEIEFLLQNLVASITANNDNANKFLMASPYTVFKYVNRDDFSNNLLKQCVELGDQSWINFAQEYKRRECKLGILAMTKISGKSGDYMLDLEKGTIAHNKLGIELTKQELTPSSPEKGILINKNDTPLLASYLKRHKKTSIQRIGLKKYDLTSNVKQFTKLLLQSYSDYISTIYTFIRCLVFTGYIHLDLHQDNFFIINDNSHFFNMARTIIIDWGKFYNIPNKDRVKYRYLWDNEQFIKILNKSLKILSSYNTKRRQNNTYKTLNTIYETVLGKHNTKILLSLYHKQCIARSEYYQREINKIWRPADNGLAVLNLETTLETVQEKSNQRIKQFLPSMHQNLLTQKGYTRKHRVTV